MLHIFEPFKNEELGKNVRQGRALAAMQIINYIYYALHSGNKMRQTVCPNCPSGTIIFSQTVCLILLPQCIFINTVSYNMYTQLLYLWERKGHSPISSPSPKL